VLKQRAEGLGPAILMSDALSRNVPKLKAGVELLFANCMAHLSNDPPALPAIRSRSDAPPRSQLRPTPLALTPDA
jgi:hypothetical protein